MDLLVTTGGASVGDHDLVIESLRQRGMTLDFWQIAMRPGKPLLFGQLGQPRAAVPVLGLPGNPVSALVCGVLFLVPAISRLLGLPGEPPPTEPALARRRPRAPTTTAPTICAPPLTPRPPASPMATPFPVQDSAMLRRLARADALILRAPHAPALPEGAEVAVIRLESHGI